MASFKICIMYNEPGLGFLIWAMASFKICIMYNSQV